MRKFYQTVLLTGITSVVIAGAALAADQPKETSLGKAYDKVVAANTSIAAKDEKTAIKSLKSAKWDLRKNDFMNKDKAQVAKDKELLTQIDAVVATLNGKEADKLKKAAPEVQKIQDAVETEMKAAPIATPASATTPATTPSSAPKAN